MKTIRELHAALQVVKPQATEATAYRFCGWVEAMTNLDSNSTRDWVDLFTEGFAGFKTPEDVASWLDSFEDAEEELQPLIVEFFA